MNICQAAEIATGWTIYQPLIVGLRAVILATLGNSFVEWLRHRLADKRDALVLRRSLIEELRLAKETADINKVRADAPEEGGSFIIPIQDRYPIYEASIQKLGLLDPDEIERVIAAYAYLNSEAEVVSVLGTIHRIEGTVLQGIIDSKYAAVLSKRSEDVSNKLSLAISALDKRSKPRRNAPRSSGDNTLT